MKAWLGAIFYCGIIILVLWGAVTSAVGMAKSIRNRDNRALMHHVAIVALCVAVCFFALGYEITRGYIFTNLLHSLR